MDNDIRVLEKIGLQEVCKKTHIEVKQLEFMINNEYEKLNRINTLGFVKILSREYKLDLSEWLEAYQIYLANNKEHEETSTKIFVHAETEKNYRGIFAFFFFVLLIGGGYYAINFFKIDVNALLGKSTQDANQTKAFQDTAIVAETAKNLGVKVEERIVETNSSNATVQSVVVPIDENLARTTNEGNKSIEKIDATNNTPAASVNLVATPKNKAIFVPVKRLWFGQIFLDENMSQKDLVGDQNISVDLTKRQIIKTGHGFFKLYYDGSVEDFTEQGSARFLVENGTIKKISEEKFIELNKGKNW